MSIVITIQKPEGEPLKVAAMEAAVDADPGFVRASNASWRLVNFDAGAELFLNLGDESLWTDGSRVWAEANPLAALRRVAAVLGARVIGEEGEDLTSDEPSKLAASHITTFQSIASLLLLPLVVVLGLLMMVVRMPWAFWKIWRTTKEK